jgi:hypothetical protein
VSPPLHEYFRDRPLKVNRFSIGVEGVGWMEAPAMQSWHVVESPSFEEWSPERN